LTLDPKDGFGPLLCDHVAVISAGGAGIGAATAALFARHGASVVVVDIDGDLAHQASSAANEVATSGGTASAIIADVTKSETVERVAKDVLSHYGRCDILINNAGHSFVAPKDFSSSEPDHWDALQKINFEHILLMTKAFLGQMIERRYGAIVNVSSVEGLRGYPPDPVYGAYKAAVIQFTRSLAVQVGNDGVRVNAIGPDVTDSAQVPYQKLVTPADEHLWPLWVPIGRMGYPIDQARVILFLASELSGFVTGQTIATDGGTGSAGGWFRSLSKKNRLWTNRPINP
jgi:NAD(P)-dependent dehydrogenase (short-subunit alcohol dehydrogenase family)